MRTDPRHIAGVGLLVLAASYGCSEGVVEFSADPAVLNIPQRDAGVSADTTDTSVEPADTGTSVTDTAMQSDTTADQPDVVDTGTEPVEETYALITPRQIALTVGETTTFGADVRGPKGTPATAEELTWSTGDEAVATVDDEGVVEAKSVGRTVVRASAPDGKSYEAILTVADGPTWRRAQMLRPSGPIAARGEPVDVRVDLREVAVASPDSAGSPVEPSEVSILVDGSAVGKADIGWEASSHTLDTAMLDSGIHRLQAEVTHDGSTYRTPVEVLAVRESDAAFADGWESLTDKPNERFSQAGRLDASNGNAPPVVIDSNNQIFVAREEPGRNGSKMVVQRWNEDKRRWDFASSRHGLQLRHYNSKHDYFPRNPAQYVDMAIDDKDRPLLTFTQEGIDTGGNGDERQKRWFDVFVVRYEQGYGSDGDAGWRLLTSGKQDYIVNTPKADDPEHPLPADVDKYDDVHTPQVMWDAGRKRVTAAWVAEPFPPEKSFLDVRAWSDAGSEWSTVGKRLELDGDIPELREAFVDGSGRIVAVVANRGATGAEAFEMWRLEPSKSEWTRLDAGGRLVATRPNAGGLAAARIDGAHLFGGTLAEPMERVSGRLLNRSGWMAARHATFAGLHGTRATPVLLWQEGPAGSKQWIHAAEHDGNWKALPVDLATRMRGSARFGAAVGPDGRLVIARPVPTPMKDDPFSLHVVRSREPLID